MPALDKKKRRSQYVKARLGQLLGWQETFDAALDINALISKDFDILKINRAGYENLGKKPEELLGKKCYQVVHGLDSPIQGCPCTMTLKTKSAGQGEIRDHGRNYIVTASPILDEKNEIVAFAHTIKDITDRVQAEAALKDAYDKMEMKVEARTADLMTANTQLRREVKERRQAEKALRKTERGLHKQKSELAQKNIALREIIAQIGLEKQRLKEEIRVNIETLVFPILERMKKDQDSTEYVRLLRHHLEYLASSYGIKISEGSQKLTPKEMEICGMVKAALTNKDIATLLNVSSQTVEWHRKRIRQKLGLANRGINLSAYLRDL
ncbi:MAG: hypothetical protein A2W03_10100 [Candidatus Aminicenantes bacterium RBG_16_63_16]|nr:MAG: hypothetical protein A2W03_10100 [Candidatus Aminicenantes bacterium RBG_16_63_16]